MKHLLPALIVLVALWVRWPMWQGGLQIDEDATLALLSQDSFAAILRSWRDHPGAAILSSFTVRLAPSDESVLVFARIPSLAAGLATVWLLYHLVVRETGSLMAGAVSSTLLALCREHVAFSTSVRGYALQAALILAMHAWYLAWLRNGRRIHWAWYWLAATWAMWTQLWAVYVLAAHGLSLLPWIRRRPREIAIAWGAQGAAVGAALLLLAPVLGEILEGNRDSPRGHEQIWIEFCSALDHNLTLIDYPGWYVRAGVLVVSLIAARGLVRFPAALATGWVLLAVPLMLFLVPPGAFATRYVLFYVPLLFAWTGWAVSATPVARWLRDRETARWRGNDLAARGLLLLLMASLGPLLLAPLAHGSNVMQGLVLFFAGLWRLLPWIALGVFPPRRMRGWEILLSAILAVFVSLALLDMLLGGRWHDRVTLLGLLGILALVERLSRPTESRTLTA